MLIFAVNAGQNITLRSVRLEEYTGGISLVTARLDLGSPLLHQGSLHLEDVEADNTNSSVMLIAGGNITITDSSFSGAQPAVISNAGRIDLSNSSFRDARGTGSSGGFGKVARLDDVANATIDADGNRWGSEDDLAVLNSYIIRSGSTPSTCWRLPV